jgi:hypothetical protein
MEFKLNVGGRYHDVLFRHGQNEQDASMFLSTEYDGIFLEEIAPAYLPGEKKVSPGIAEGVFDMALARLTREVDRAAAIRPELCMTCNSPPLPHWGSKRIIDKPPAYLLDLNWAQWCFPISDNAQNIRPDYYTNLEKAWEGKRALIARFLKGERLPIFVGIPRFNMDKLDEMRMLTIDPPFRGWLKDTADNPLHVKLEANQEGWVKMWKPPISGHQYCIGADSAEGIEGGDYSAAFVLDRDDESICAAWHGHIEPEAFGAELAKLGYLYNRASIAVETFPSAHGLATALNLKNSNYPRLYWHKSLDSRSKRQQRLGWVNDSKSKPIMVDGIATHLDSFDLADPTAATIPDRELINELMSFGVMENGSCEAQEGCYDDRTIAFGIALKTNKVAGMSTFFPNLNKQAPDLVPNP